MLWITIIILKLEQTYSLYGLCSMHSMLPNAHLKFSSVLFATCNSAKSLVETREQTNIKLACHFQYRLLRARRALSIFKDVLRRTRRALSLYKVYRYRYVDSASLVLNGTSLNIDGALLALNWWYLGRRHKILCLNSQIYFDKLFW